MLVPRQIIAHLRELSEYFPIVSLTGPRQAGKTTLLRHLYPDYRYVSLEDPDQRLSAAEDPRDFLKQYDNAVIFDEVQRVPSLFSYLQTLVDEDRQAGRFLLSGSQNFLLHQNIKQSLAGRVGVARLMPLDLREIGEANLLPEDYETATFNGGYPAQFDTGIPPRLFYPSYVASYVERDVSGLISAANLNTFQRFLQLTASFAGQLLNYSAMAKSVGVSVPTVKNWLSILEQSYLVFRLPPFYKNVGRRVVKTPKLYFYDTGLLCYLLGMQSPHDVVNYYQRGALFENLVAADFVKRSWHTGTPPKVYFYRDSNQLEVDLVEEKPNAIRLTEIKANRTYKPKLLSALNRVAQLMDKPVEKALVYGGDERFDAKGVSVYPWSSPRF